MLEINGVYFLLLRASCKTASLEKFSSKSSTSFLVLGYATSLKISCKSRDFNLGMSSKGRMGARQNSAFLASSSTLSQSRIKRSHFGHVLFSNRKIPPHLQGSIIRS